MRIIIADDDRLVCDSLKIILGAQPDVEVVTIVGRDGDAEITLDEMARLRGTINYEVACDFGMRLEKVYL